MSDFTSDFWGIYITGVTLVSIIACGWLLWAVGKARVSAKPAADGKETTGHVWDGDLAEYNNPLPKWWLWLFIITIVFSLLYLVLYPGLGTMTGIWNWSSTGQYEKEVAEVNKVVQPLYERFSKQDLKVVAADQQARGMGERLFLNHCAQCHGSDAGGSKGFPSLRDEEWLYGGDPEKIKESILGGRKGVMPPLGAAIGDEGVKNVVQYVRSLSGLAHDSVKAQLGKPLFAANCSACHGPEGKGMQALGAPDLTNKVWLYGSSEKDITEGIMNGRNMTSATSPMPALKDTLGDAKAHLIAAYVWSLTNQPRAAAAK
jgi:cytochrome c oxidase cbb3-type subunit 3